MKRSYFEWDENKNTTNKKKHKIGFESIDELYADKHLVQMVERSEKWEDLGALPDSVEKNYGNLDPIRSKLTGQINGKLYTAVYTYRGSEMNLKYRVISLRRADKNEENFYNKCSS